MNRNTSIQFSMDIHWNSDRPSEEVFFTVNGVPVETFGAKKEASKPMSMIAPPSSFLGKRWRDFRSDAFAYSLFIRLSAYAPIILAAVCLLQYLAYRQIFAGSPHFAARYGWWLLYLDISVVALTAVLGYLRAYHLNTSHMMSMMIGMVIGMQSGTMVGAVIGATNGLFVGAMTGMFVGGLSGIYIGCRCGSTMAILQGLMSGGMAGTMGAMLIAMMLDDHVLYFMPFFTLANILILLGFTYLFHEHGVATGECSLRNRDPGFFSLFGLNVCATALLAALMIYGPKGSMVWTGEPAGPMDMACGKSHGMGMSGMDMGKMK